MLVFRNVDTKIAEVILGIDMYISTVTWYDGLGGHSTTNIKTLNLLDCDASK